MLIQMYKLLVLPILYVGTHATLTEATPKQLDDFLYVHSVIILLVILFWYNCL